MLSLQMNESRTPSPALSSEDFHTAGHDLPFEQDAIGVQTKIEAVAILDFVIMLVGISSPHHKFVIAS